MGGRGGLFLFLRGELDFGRVRQVGQSRTRRTERTGHWGETPFTCRRHVRTGEGDSDGANRVGRGQRGSDGTDWSWINFAGGNKQTGHATICMPGYIKSKLRLLVKTECDRNVVPYVYGMAVHLTGGKFLLQGTDSSYSFLVEIGVFTTGHLNFTDRTILGNDE